MIGRSARAAADGRGRVRRMGLGDSGIALDWSRAILATLAALCQVAIFPPVEWTALGWVALTPLFLAAPTERSWAAVAVAWLFGTLATLGLVAPWLSPALREFFGTSFLTTLLALVIVSQVAGGLPLAVLGVLLARGARLSPPARALHAAASWVAIEYVRVHVPATIPWALLGSALPPSAAPAQVADLGGVYAVSFLMALAGAAAAEAVRATWSGRRVAVSSRSSLRGGGGAVVVAIALLTATAIYGAVRRNTVTAEIASAPTLRIAIAHADLPNVRRQSPQAAPAALDRYLELSAGAADADLVVWPENAVNLLLEDNPELLARITARAGATSYLVGAPRAVPTATGAVLRTSALLVDAGGVRARYDKRQLLPFAETMPALRGAGRAVPRGFAPGEGTAVLIAGDARLGLLLCHEALFPALARAAVREGAELLVNLSNDSWFPPGAGPRQHFAFGRLRAVESRRALVRAANGGVTAIVLPDGSTPIATDGTTPGLEIAAVPRLTTLTVYTRLGDLFAWTCLIGAVAVAVVGHGRRGARGH